LFGKETLAQSIAQSNLRRRRQDKTREEGEEEMRIKEKRIFR
jgi:hypothetical protein